MEISITPRISSRTLRNSIGNLHALPPEQHQLHNYRPNKGTQDVLGVQPFIDSAMNGVETSVFVPTSVVSLLCLADR